MLATKIKEKLAAGEVSIGSWMSMAHVSITEILSGAGFGKGSAPSANGFFATTHRS